MAGWTVAGAGRALRFVTLNMQGFWLDEHVAFAGAHLSPDPPEAIEDGESSPVLSLPFGMKIV